MLRIIGNRIFDILSIEWLTRGKESIVLDYKEFHFSSRSIFRHLAKLITLDPRELNYRGEMRKSLADDFTISRLKTFDR